MKNRFFWALLAIGLSDIQNLYARAGGGSGGGRGIGSIVALIYVAILLIIIRRKSKKAKIQIDKIHLTDPFWDYDSMIALVKEVFNQMQVAWGERNMELVKDLVTRDLYNDFQKQLDWKKVKHEKNIIEDIDIKKIRIIGDEEDAKDKSNDKFTAYIFGKMVDYAIDDRTGKKLVLYSSKKEKFSDLYYFVRQDDKWLLDKIQNRVTLAEVVKVKQKVQD